MLVDFPRKRAEHGGDSDGGHFRESELNTTAILMVAISAKARGTAAPLAEKLHLEGLWGEGQHAAGNLPFAVRFNADSPGAVNKKLLCNMHMQFHLDGKDILLNGSQYLLIIKV